MTYGAIIALFVYSTSLMALAAWCAAFSSLPLINRLRRRTTHDFSSRFWFFLGIAPLLAGVTVGVGSISSAVLKGFSLIPDHCQLHPGHPHLCWTHGETPYSGGLLFWVLFAGVSGLILLSIWKVGCSLVEMSWTLREAVEVRHEDGFRFVPSQMPAAFVAGFFRPQVYLTTAAFRLLSPNERKIVVAHEQEHVSRRDPMKLALLRIASSLFPGYRWIEEKWKTVAETECDIACLAKGASAVEVSLTILKLARTAGPSSGAPALAYAQAPEQVLRLRVERLLSGVQPAQSRLSWSVPVLVAFLTASLLSSMHHVLETILGTLLG